MGGWDLLNVYHEQTQWLLVLIDMLKMTGYLRYLPCLLSYYHDYSYSVILTSEMQKSE